MAAHISRAGDPDITDKLLKGYDVDSKHFKAHLDGYNQLPYLTGQLEHGARKVFFYFNDDGDLCCFRYENWEFVFEEQQVPGTLLVWGEPFTKLRFMKFHDLHADPYERADITSNTYWDWCLNHAYLGAAVQAVVGEFLATFKDYPPAQRAASFTIDQAVDTLRKDLGGD